MHTPTAVIANPNEFRGFPVDLVRGLVGMGPAVIDNPVLFEAVEAYRVSQGTNGVGAMGPALLTEDCNQVVQSITWVPIPEDLGKPVAPVVAVAETTGWDGYDLDQLNALCRARGVEIKGRVRTHGKLTAALDAAGVTP